MGEDEDARHTSEPAVGGIQDNAKTQEIEDRAAKRSAAERRPAHQAELYSRFKPINAQQGKLTIRQHGASRTSTIAWHKRWRDDSWCDGRVLVIDYIRQDMEKEGKLQIATQEFHEERTLTSFYRDEKKCNQAALRVIHVQNASWAVKFLTAKFNMSSANDLVGFNFGQWARFEKPEFRAGKPLLKGRTWRTQRDPWRGVKRFAFGADYLKHYGTKLTEAEAMQPREGTARKMMELNCYDDSENANYGYDVFVQRLSTYVQLRDKSLELPEDVSSPYCTEDEWSSRDQQQGNRQGNGQAEKAHPGNLNCHPQKLPPYALFDNSNTIIVFENSETNSVRDTLLAARDEIESRWRRLTFFLPREDTTTDERLAQECMNFIVQDIFKGLAYNWDMFLNISETHVGILEDKIYESPADETRAPELWLNSSLWLKVEKLITIHIDVVKEVVDRLEDLAEYDRKWLEGTVEEFEKLSNMIQEDLVKPTNNLSDLMYKSVGIRDSRHSLQLNTSLWRLSWITFIFLPLTFIVGFFGMNVDAFSGDPSIKWYFVAAVCLMIVVLIGWYVIKHLLTTYRQTPYQRGVYEHFFHDLATAYPDKWSRNGPKRLRPVSLWDSIRWRLLKRWFDPARTIHARPLDPDEDVGGSGLGVWAKCKRKLARRWLGSINVKPDPGAGNEDGEGEEAAGAVTELLAFATPIAVTEAEPAAAEVTVENLSKLGLPSHLDRGRGRGRRPSSGSRARLSSSAGSSGTMMVEEQDLQEEGGNAGADGGELSGGRGGVGRSADGILDGEDRHTERRSLSTRRGA